MKFWLNRRSFISAVLQLCDSGWRSHSYPNSYIGTLFSFIASGSKLRESLRKSLSYSTSDLRNIYSGLKLMSEQRPLWSATGVRFVAPSTFMVLLLLIITMYMCESYIGNLLSFIASGSKLREIVRKTPSYTTSYLGNIFSGLELMNEQRPSRSATGLRFVAPSTFIVLLLLTISMYACKSYIGNLFCFIASGSKLRESVRKSRSYSTSDLGNIFSGLKLINEQRSLWSATGVRIVAPYTFNGLNIQHFRKPIISS